MDPRLSGPEMIPGSSDRTARGPMAHYWHVRQERCRELSDLALQMALCEKSLNTHKKHCRRHHNDQEALIRLAHLVLRRDDITPLLETARRRLNVADTDYRKKVVELSDLPWFMKKFPAVDIIDNDGSVRIHFGMGRSDRDREGRWVLFANGAVRRERTPEGVD